MYANGRGVARNDAIAAQLFTMASRAGSLQAVNMLRVVGNPAPDLLECLREKVAPPQIAEVEDVTDSLFAGASPNQRSIIELVLRLAPEYQVNPKLAIAVIKAESAFNVNARSPKNALGLMQLIPETAARFNVKNAFDPVQNIRGGLAYLRWLLAYFRGDVALVAAGYNAGEGTVDRYRGIPPYRETQGYVKSILSVFNSTEHPYDPSIIDPSPVTQRRFSAR
jgi:soluble lytic murein transglycosylase-like protein